MNERACAGGRDSEWSGSFGAVQSTAAYGKQLWCVGTMRLCFALFCFVLLCCFAPPRMYLRNGSPLVRSPVPGTMCTVGTRLPTRWLVRSPADVGVYKYIYSVYVIHLARLYMQYTYTQCMLYISGVL